jgi:hypothetical protein
MRTLLSIIFLVVVGTLGTAQIRTGHPRIFFGQSDIGSLRTRITSGDPKLLYEDIVHQSDYYGSYPLYDLGDPAHRKDAFYEGMVSLAFRYLMTGEPMWITRLDSMIFASPSGIIFDQYPGQWGEVGGRPRHRRDPPPFEVPRCELYFSLRHAFATPGGTHASGAGGW